MSDKTRNSYIVLHAGVLTRYSLGTVDLSVSDQVVQKPEAGLEGFDTDMETRRKLVPGVETHATAQGVGARRTSDTLEGGAVEIGAGLTRNA